MQKAEKASRIRVEHLQETAQTHHAALVALQKQVYITIIAYYRYAVEGIASTQLHYCNYQSISFAQREQYCSC
jgi:hypothetical protein